MAEFVIKHVLGPNFTSSNASGLLMSGPTPDGSILMTFFRDSVRYVSETYTYGDDLTAGSQVRLGAPDYKSEVVREDVATISVPVSAFEEVVRVMNERMEMMRAKVDQEGVP